MNPVIELKNASKTYKIGKINLDILKNINLKIDKGSFVVILGPSGSGKSTLLNIISCLDTPSSGNVFLDGEDLSLLSEDSLSKIRGKKIGFIFQQFNLIQHLNALENVSLPMIFQGVLDLERERRAKELLTSFGLKDRFHHRPLELSGGEQQRVAVSRALVNDPEIIVADEPTGNVDSKTGERIMDILKDLNKNKGKTVIIVTHDRDIAKDVDKVINIKDGQIV